jgi:catechol 2,3-dioxygenase-like lactoylglutathione lyase family enzyme
MTSITLGKRSKIVIRPSDRDRVRRFYGDVLGCRVTVKSNSMDLLQLGTDFYIGVVYDDNALSDVDRLNTIWLELLVDDPEGLKEQILEFGCKEVEFWDKEHFYFQAPGGQVFRVAGKTEDMSKWQQ